MQPQELMNLLAKGFDSSDSCQLALNKSKEVFKEINNQNIEEFKKEDLKIMIGKNFAANTLMAVIKIVIDLISRENCHPVKKDLVHLLGQIISVTEELMDETNNFKELTKTNIEQIHLKSTSIESINKIDVINKIRSLLEECNKDNCIYCINEITVFLSDKSYFVRQLAYSAICIFIRLASLSIISNSSSENTSVMLPQLQTAIESVIDISIDNQVPPELQLQLSETLKFAKLSILSSEIGKKRLSISEEFLNTSINNSIKRLIDSVKFKKKEI